MKVLMLSTSFPRWNGDYYARGVYELSKLLVKKGVSVKVLAPHAKDAKIYEVLDGIEIYRFRYFFFENLAYNNGLYKNFKRLDNLLVLPIFMFFFFINALRLSKDVDVINAHWTVAGLIGGIVKIFNKKRLILTVRGSDLREIPKPITKLIFKQIDHVIAVAPEMVDLAKQFNKPITEIQNTIDSSKFNKNVNPEKIKKEFNIKYSAVTLVARLYWFKDPLTFIEAMPYVKSKVTFLVVGDGEQIQQIKSRTKELNLKNVIITGPRSDINEIYAASEVILGISVVENVWSNTIVEAIMMAKSCILTDVGYTSKVFTHMKNAYIIQPKNPKILAKAIDYLLKNKKIRIKLGEDALKLSKIFDEDYIFNQTIKIYKKD